VNGNNAQNSGGAYSNIYLASSNYNNVTWNNASSNGSTRYGIYLTSSNYNNVTGNNASNTAYYPIELTTSSHNNVSWNNASNSVSYSGISLDSASNYNNLTWNNFLSNANYGIYLSASNNNTMIANNATYNAYSGIFLTSSYNNTLTVNNASFNTQYGIYLSSSNNANISGNTALNNTLYGIYLLSSNNANITGNSALNNGNYGIYLYASNYTNVTGNNASYSGLTWPLNGRGIFVIYSKNENLTGNNASFNSQAGITLTVSDNNNLTGNTALNNTWFGIYLWGAKNNNLTANTALNNGWSGFLVQYSNFTNLTWNNASGNTQYGIWLYGANSDNLTVNNASYNGLYGIALDVSSKNNTLIWNNASFNAQYGIFVNTSTNNTLIANNAPNNTQYGIYLYASINNTLQNNTMDGNTLGSLWVDGTQCSHFNNSIDTSNTKNGLRVLYFNNTGNFTLDALVSPNQSYGAIIVACSSNVTIRNYVISQDSIYLYNTTNSTITNNTITSGNYGIYLNASSNNNALTGNNASFNTLYGIYIYSSNNTVLSANNVSGNTQHGVYLAVSNNTNLSWNNASFNSQNGIYLYSSINNSMTGNNVSNNTQYGIFLSYSNSNNLTGNNASGNTGHGILLNVSNNNNLTGNSAQFDIQHGIYLNSSINNTLNWNNASNNAQDGIILLNSSNNNLAWNNASGNSQYGILLNASNNNNLTGNSAPFNAQHGIYLNSSVNNTLVANNASGNTQYGIYLYASGNNTLQNNVIDGNSLGSLWVDGTQCSHFNNSIDTSNTKNGLRVLYFNNTGSGTLNITLDALISPNQSYGSIIVACSRNFTIKNYVISQDSIYLYNTTNSTISNNTIYSGNYGIYLRYSNYTNVTGNNASFNARYGIYLDTSNRTSMTSNNASGNSQYGIYLSYSNQTYMNGNNASFNAQYGIYLDSSANNTLQSNTMNGNTLGSLWVDGSRCAHFNNSIDTSNTKNGIQVLYFNSTLNVTLNASVASNQSYGPIIIGCSRNVTILNYAIQQDSIYVYNSSNWTYISNNTVSSGNYGIYIRYSNNTNITLNNASFNAMYGIYIDTSNRTNMTSNNASFNTRYGIYLSYSNQTNITANNASGNGQYGICLSYSNNNNLTQNDASFNSQYGIYSVNSTGNLFANSTSLNNANYDVGMSSRSNATFLNTTFNKDAVYCDSTSNMTVQWYVQVSVINGFLLTPLKDTNVTVVNNASQLVWTQNTTSDGLTNRQIVAEYFQYSSSKTNYTPHNITAVNETIGAAASTVLNVDHSMIVNLAISSSSLVISVLSPLNQSYNTTSMWANVSLNEDGLCNLSMDGGGNTSMSNITQNFYNFTTGLAEGLHYVTFYCSDFTGNSQSSVQYFTVDLTPPEITVQSPLNQTYNTSSIWANVTLNEPGSCNRSFDGSANASMTNSTGNFNNITAGFSDGLHSVTFYCNDTTGNLNSTTSYFNIDTTPPFVYLFSPANTSYTATTVSLIYYVSDSGGVGVNMTWYQYNGANSTLSENTTFTALNNQVSTLILWANDSAGNLNSTNVAFTMDTVLPTITIQSPGNQTYNTSSVWSNVTLSENGSCNVSLDGGGNTSMSNTTGNHNNLTTGISDGLHSVTFYCNDTAGNLNSTARYFSIDTAPPVITIQSPINQSYSTTSVWANVTLNEAGSCNVSLNNTANVSMSNTTGNFNYNLTNLAQGFNNVTFYCNDTVGNRNSTTRYFRIDTTQPFVYLFSPTNTSYNTTSISLNYYVSDSGAGVGTILYQYNGANNTLSGNTTITASEGENTVVLYANDSAGNLNATNVSFFVDSIYPIVMVYSPTNTTTYATSAVWLNWTVAETNLGPCQYSVNNSANSSITTNVSLTLPDGLHNVSVSCKDTLGKWNSNITYFRIDTTRPFVYLFSPTNTSYNTTSISLNYYVSDSGAGVGTILYQYNGANNTLSGNTTFTASEGENTVVLYANDSAGNLNATNVSFFVDSIYPIVMVYSPTNTTTYATSAVWLNWTVAETNLGPCQYSVNNSANSSITTNVSLTLPDGLHNVSVSCKDTLGKWNSNITYFRIDTTRPFVYLFSPTNTSYNTTSISLNYYVSDSGAGVGTILYQYNGANNTLSGNTTITALDNQLSTLILWANDSVGNANSTNVTFVVDTTIPIISGVLSNDTWAGTNTTIIANVTDNYNVSSVWAQVYAPDGSVSNVTLANSTVGYSANYTTSQLGSYNVTVWANDTSGNANCTGANYTFHALTLPIMQDKSSYNLEEQVTFSFNATDPTSNYFANVTSASACISSQPAAPSTCDVYNVTSVVQVGTGRYTASWLPPLNTTFGNYTVYVRATINGWERQNFTQNFSVSDTEAPLLLSLSINNTWAGTNTTVLSHAFDNYKLNASWATIYTPGGAAENLTLNTSGEGDSWWNQSWMHRRMIILNETVGSDRTNEPVDLNVSGLVLFTDNCSRELRMTNQSGGEIPFQVISSSDGASLSQWSKWCRIVFLANQSANTAATYYAYYGSNNAVRSALYGKIFLLYERFDAFPSGWLTGGNITKTTDTYWDYSPPYSARLDEGGGSQTHAWRTDIAPDASSMRVSARVRLGSISPGNNTQLFSIFDSRDNVYFVAIVRENTGNYMWGIDYYNGTGSSWTESLNPALEHYARLNAWYAVELYHNNSGGINLYVDGALVKGIAGMANPVPDRSTFGFAGATPMDYNSTIFIDNYAVWNVSVNLYPIPLESNVREAGWYSGVRNLSTLGAYNVTVFANDTSGNTNSSSSNYTVLSLALPIATNATAYNTTETVLVSVNVSDLSGHFADPDATPVACISHASSDPSLCDVYNVTLARDGAGMYSGTWQTDTDTGQNTYSAFARAWINGGLVNVNSTNFSMIATIKPVNITVNAAPGEEGNYSIWVRVRDSTGTTVCSSDTGSLQCDLLLFHNYTLELEANLSSGNLSASFYDLNVTNVTNGPLNITAQIVGNYTREMPYQINALTPVFAVNDSLLSYSHAKLVVPKAGLPNVIMVVHCTSWNFTTANCSAWSFSRASSYYGFDENATRLWFNVSRFAAYAGGQPYNATLVIWDDTDSQGGSHNRSSGESVGFFANYTNSTNGGPINGSGIWCNISFFNVSGSGSWTAPANMSYDPVNNGSYNYTMTFWNPGTYYWNVTCDGSTQSYVVLNVTDSITIMNSPPQISGVSAVPSVSGYGRNVTINATVTDLDLNLASVWVNISAPDGTSANHSMMNVPSTSIFQYNFTSFMNGTYNFTVWANDSFGEYSRSSIGQFNIYVVLYANIKTVKDDYIDGETVNITDPPGGGMNFVLPPSSSSHENQVVDEADEAASAMPQPEAYGNASGSSSLVHQQTKASDSNDGSFISRLFRTIFGGETGKK